MSPQETKWSPQKKKKKKKFFFFFFRETPTSPLVPFRAKFRPLGRLFRPIGPLAWSLVLMARGQASINSSKNQQRWDFFVWPKSEMPVRVLQTICWKATLSVTYFSLTTSANGAELYQTLQNVASDQVLHCLLTEWTFKIWMKLKLTIQQPLKGYVR